MVWQADYDIYGGVRNLKGERGFVPFRQLGQYEDEETGLYYNRFRYYDSSAGSYISQDPIGLAGNNPTLYAYVADVNLLLDVFGLLIKEETVHRKVAEKGLENVKVTSYGGLDYSESDYLYPDKSKAIQTIDYTSTYSGDFSAANKAAGFDSTPDGYTWHHLDDYDAVTKTGTVQLVQKDAHTGVSHNGGKSQQKHNH